MAVSASESQNAVIATLNDLLQRARIVKPSTTIDPPLQVSDLVPESEPLFDDIEGEDEARKLAVDSAAKFLFYANLVSPLCPWLVRFAHTPRVQPVSTMPPL